MWVQIMAEIWVSGIDFILDLRFGTSAPFDFAQGKSLSRTILD
ncbi:hypothetical protein GXM_06677 [Nostoc sphaeroides CCNUC1]|uniref:Uncharacterized protein n=1 Tax=Nostoc sphaeroides CCNUC1 TaxID=2653204 RepID=A0A5P8W8S5_9NOSO|nr:hypothetical protein GXM_06677 [Nostoc sphaeroides CCNUC1]